MHEQDDVQDRRVGVYFVESMKILVLSTMYLLKEQYH